MASPIEFQILQNLQTALKGISKRTGYYRDLSAFAVKLDPNQSVETLIGAQAYRPFMILEVQPTRFEHLDSPGTRLNIVLPIVVHVIDDSDPTDDDSWMQTFFELCADVEQAIAADESRGGLADETEIRSCEYHTEGGAMVWAMVKAEISIFRNYGAPNG